MKFDEYSLVAQRGSRSDQSLDDLILDPVLGIELTQILTFKIYTYLKYLPPPHPHPTPPTPTLLHYTHFPLPLLPLHAIYPIL